MSRITVADIAVCPDCGSPHLGRCGGLTFAQRLRSVRLDSEAVPTRTRRGWWDNEAADNLFGHDRVDRYYDETDGHGALSRADIETIDPDVLDKVYLGAGTEHEDTSV